MVHVSPVKGQPRLTRIDCTLRDAEPTTIGVEFVVMGTPPCERFALIEAALPQGGSKPDGASVVEAVRAYLRVHSAESWPSKIALCHDAGVGEKAGAKAIDELVKSGELIRNADGRYRAASKPSYINGEVRP